VPSRGERIGKDFRNGQRKIGQHVAARQRIAFKQKFNIGSIIPSPFTQ